MSNQELVLHLEENFQICSILTEGCINSLRFILISPIMLIHTFKSRFFVWPWNRHAKIFVSMYEYFSIVAFRFTKTILKSYIYCITLLAVSILFKASPLSQSWPVVRMRGRTSASRSRGTIAHLPHTFTNAAPASSLSIQWSWRQKQRPPSNHSNITGGVVHCVQSMQLINAYQVCTY